MPVELKKLIFSNEEVQVALVNYCIRHNTKMPGTAISRVVVNWEPDITSDLFFFADEGDGEGKTLNFSNEEVAAALILYCQHLHAPLPHDAEKTLAPIEGGVSLSIRYSWGEMVRKDHPGFSVPWMSGDGDEKETGGA